MGFAGALVVLLIATGCYQPSAADCSYMCNAGACPTGLHCVNNFCREDPRATGVCRPTSGDGSLDVFASPYVQSVLMDQPAAYFRLGETSGTTAANMIPMTPSGMYIGGVHLGAPGALSDLSTAVTFKPTSGPQCVKVMSDPAFEVSAEVSFSLEAWIKLDSYEMSIVEIAGKLGGPTPAGYSLGLQYEPTALRSRLRLRIGDGAMGETAIGMGAPSPFLDLDTWYHVAATLDSQTEQVKFYMNGAPMGMANLTRQPVLVPSAGFTIGCQDESGTLTAGFNGTIDEVAFYRSVLTPERVMTHYASR
jgi:hypothetical protein